MFLKQIYDVMLTRRWISCCRDKSRLPKIRGRNSTPKFLRVAIPMLMLQKDSVLKDHYLEDSRTTFRGGKNYEMFVYADESVCCSSTIL